VYRASLRKFELIGNFFLMALKSGVLYNALMNWKLILILVTGTCFCISSVGYLFVKIVLRPKQGGDWEEYHWEFEEQDRSLARYHIWSKITFSAVIISMLLWFITLSI
jgi:hypothetical protein